MPILKIKQNGQWESIGAVTNAATLNGKPDSYFAAASDVDELQRKVGSTDVPTQIEEAIITKSDIGHSHDDLYYTEIEVDDKLDIMQSYIDSKMDVTDGMGLSTNDYTTAEKDKLAGIEDGANAYVHPDYTPRGSGLYKLSIDEFGHVYEAAAVVKDDIVALGIPSEDTNTTYDDELSALTTRVDELQEDVNDAKNSADQVAANLSGYMESNDTAVGNNTGNIAKNAGEIEAIKADYLTSADKEELNGRIDELTEDVADNATAIGVLNGDSEGSVNYKIDQAFNEFATNISNDNVVNTYKELVDYAASHSAEFTELVGEVTQLQTDVENLESDYSGYKESVASQFNDVEAAINEHVLNTGNPHDVTAEQIGLGDVDNTADLNKPISIATQDALDALQADIDNHVANKDNPHEVTKTQIGLDNVDNTADLDKPISNATQAALDAKANLETIDNHVADVENPHEVTAEQVGALPITGGIMEGMITLNGIVLTEGIDYGSDDPAGGVLGQLYFKKVT